MTMGTAAIVLLALLAQAVVTTGVLFFVEGRRVTVSPPMSGETTGLVAWMGF
jgi:hypothetical protein